MLGFSYHDLMARLQTFGPENAWKRLQEILRWFEEVEAAGDYRKYYDGKREGTLQGSGTAGGLGLDQEFFESAMVPQVMLYGFLGFAPRADGFKIEPRLPADWPELAVDRSRFQNLVLRIRATREVIEIHKEGAASGPMFVEVPKGPWKASLLREDGSALGEATVRKRPSDGAFELDWGSATAVRLVNGINGP